MTNRLQSMAIGGLIFAIALIGQSGSADAAKKNKGSTFPTTNSVGNLGAGIGDDSSGDYTAGEDCVKGVGGTQGGGVSKFSTIDKDDDLCVALPRGSWRYLTFDFGAGNAPGDLDGDGLAEQVEQAPSAWAINSPFNSTPNAGRIVIWVLGVDSKNNADPTDDTLSGEGKAWRLEYQDEGAVASDGDSRVITPGGIAMADLYQTVFITKGKNKIFRNEVHVGAFSMPFYLTVAPVVE